MGVSRQDGIFERAITFPVTRNATAFTTDPTASTVMADSGALNEAQGGVGSYEVVICVAATAQARLTIQHRNADNDGNVGDAHDILCPEGNMIAIPFALTTTALGQRVRVIMESNLTGDLAAWLTARRVG